MPTLFIVFGLRFHFFSRKLIYSILALIIPILIQTTNGQSNGWYHITDSTKMAFDKTPIVVASDFEYLAIDSMQQPSTSNYFPGEVLYIINGKVSTAKTKDFADATEKAIGKQIGFLYNGEIIVAPQPNLRIEGGHFQITPSYLNDRKKMMQLYENLKKEMTPP